MVKTLPMHNLPFAETHPHPAIDFQYPLFELENLQCPGNSFQSVLHCLFFTFFVVVVLVVKLCQTHRDKVSD